jgi:hypothetical protein
MGLVSQAERREQNKVPVNVTRLTTIGHTINTLPTENSNLYL